MRPPNQMNKVIDYIGAEGIAAMPSDYKVAALLGVSRDTVRRAREQVTRDKVHSDLAALIAESKPKEVIWREEDEDDGRVVTVKYRVDQEKAEDFVANLHGDGSVADVPLDLDLEEV